MSGSFLRDNDVCVVGCGAVLPQAIGLPALWSRLMAGESLVRPMPAERWPVERYLVPVEQRTRSGDKLYSVHAGWIDEDDLRRQRDRLGLPADADRLRTMALAAADEALAGVARDVAAERSALLIGCMDQDESLGNLRFLREEEPFLRRALADMPAAVQNETVARIARYFEPVRSSQERYRAALFPTSVLGALRERFALRGEAALIDAACASSLAALGQAMEALRSGEIDFALAGGIESNLGPESFALFSRLNALAAERCRPLDRRGDGLNQGEGAVLFALKRLADARAAGDRILGILRACGGSTDGRSASLFEPTADGQVLALERAYAGLDRSRVAYLECHGTGTRVGDATELASTARFFGERALPVGTSKALFGHTKGAAGAVGLAKCLLALRHGVLPPMPGCTEPQAMGNQFVNTKPLPFPELEGALYLGVSSFGFGGANYHLVVERYDSGAPTAGAVQKTTEELALCGHVRVALTEVDALGVSARFHLPPRSLPQIDELQLAALQGCATLLRDALPLGNGLDPARVSVIAAGALGTDASVALGMRVRYHELPAALPDAPAEMTALLHAMRQHRPDVTEDTGPGMLNNVIAGRVAHFFDFRGGAFAVDADFASLPVALRRAAALLREDAQVVVLIAALEKEADDGRGLIREGVECLLLATQTEALQIGLPLRGVVRAELAPAEVPA